MILIPEQISYLRSKRRRIKENIENYEDYLKSREIVEVNDSFRTLVGDPLTEEQYQRQLAEYKEVIELLSKSDYQQEIPTDSIGLGTKFTVKFDDTDAEYSIILTEAMYGRFGNYEFIDRDSLLGQNVMGKTVGDIFEYYVLRGKGPSAKARVSGTIIDVKKEQNDYLHYIREKSTNKRISHSARRSLHQLLMSTSPKDREEYQKWQQITESQEFLLSLEADRLVRQSKSNASISRLAVVRKLLATSTVATPPINGTIGIGSRFEIIISVDGKDTETRKCEMINRAVSDELTDEYIERISSLGQSLFGLQENDKFTFRKDNKTYTGVVCNVIVPTKQQNNAVTSTTPIQYQKK